MIAMFGIHRTNHSNVIGMPRDIGQDFRKLEAALSVAGKLEGASQQIRCPLFIVHHFGGRLLPIVFRKFGLRIEQVDMTWPSMHKELDDRCRSR